MKCETHDFYCLNCGRKSIPLPRKRSHFHERGHRKKLYCPWCRQEVNHIEISTMQEAEKFISDFQKGKYKDEAEASIRVVCGSGMRQIYLGA